MSKTYKIKLGDGKLKIDLPADKYLIVQDDNNGVITVTCTPSDQDNVKKEFQSQLEGVNGEIRAGTGRFRHAPNGAHAFAKFTTWPTSFGQAPNNCDTALAIWAGP